jgi:hypothetical protein
VLFQIKTAMELYSQGVPNGHSNQKGIDRKTGKNFYEKQIFAIVRDIVVSVDYSLVCSSRNGVYPVRSGSFNVYWYWYNHKRIQYIEVLIIGFSPWILCT